MYILGKLFMQTFSKYYVVIAWSYNNRPWSTASAYYQTIMPSQLVFIPIIHQTVMKNQEKQDNKIIVVSVKKSFCQNLWVTDCQCDIALVPIYLKYLITSQYKASPPDRNLLEIPEYHSTL